MKRAQRRHELERLKVKRARWHWGQVLQGDARRIGVAVITPKPCSNPWCCGNYRVYSGPTRQEKNAELKLRETT